MRACHSIFRGRLRASVCTGRVRPHTKGNIKAYSWCRDADAVGGQAVASGSPSFQRHSCGPRACPGHRPHVPDIGDIGHPLQVGWDRVKADEESREEKDGDGSHGTHERGDLE